jgi:hypothetical protein
VRLQKVAALIVGQRDDPGVALRHRIVSSSSVTTRISAML